MKQLIFTLLIVSSLATNARVVTEMKKHLLILMGSFITANTNAQIEITKPIEE